MKQCPNPNCILYTRLEELPDAYVKCPSCGGLLVSSDLSSRVLKSGHLSRSTTGSSLFGGLVQSDFDDTTDHEQRSVASLRSVADPDYAFEDEYAYDEAADPQDYEYAEPIPRRPGGGKVALLVGTLLLLSACIAISLIVGSRFLPHPGLVSSPQATETALASLRPAVNTAIPILPTIAPSGLGANAVGATPVFGRSPIETGLPSGPQSSANSQSQSQPPAAPTTPPAQTQPGAGVLDARMNVRLEGGKPTGDVSAYGPYDTFNLAVEANFGAGGVTSITTHWYGPGGTQIYQIRKEYSQPGTYYVGFTLKKDGPWPPGDYRVDVHANDSPTPSYSVPFSVIP
jgi:hypothetical protein